MSPLSDSYRCYNLRTWAGYVSQNLIAIQDGSARTAPIQVDSVMGVLFAVISQCS